jgi:hypothetical protein
VPWFEDVTAAAGVTFRHFDPATAEHYIHETIGSGLGWIDYDGDGRLDLFCVQQGPARPAAGGPRPTNRLYRNNGDGTFTDVTEAAGLARAGFGMGCAVGDFDNDGFDDLAVTYLGGVVLYRNVPAPGGGRAFEDVTAAAGLADPHWASSCGWADVDNDGLLDLYVCNYCELDLDHYPRCEVPGKGRQICPPSMFPYTTHRLYRNKGGGAFEDVSGPSGVAAAPPAPGLGVLLLDLDGDGRQDVYVANDQAASYLFHNRGGGRFAEVGVTSGAGLDLGGRYMAGMGVDAADTDGSGRPSVFVTNFQRLPNILFRNLGGMQFADANLASGLGPPSVNRLGFGTAFLDADLDGSPDVAVANGHVRRNAAEFDGTSYAQEPLFFVGDGKGRFKDVSAQAGPYFRSKVVGRGLAWADFDNDGKPDLAVSHVGGPVALLRNATPTENRWVRLDLEGDGKASNRNAIGSRVEVEAGGRKQTRWVAGGGSYLSAGDRRVLVGLGSAATVTRVTVRWPSGREQSFGPLEAGRGYLLREGDATPRPRP